MTWWTCWQKKLADVNEWMICGWSPRPFGSDLCNDERQPWNFPKTLRWFFSFLLRASRCCDTALDFINSRFCSCQVCNSRYFNFKKALGQLGRATPLEFRWHKSGRKPSNSSGRKPSNLGIFSAGEPWYREDLRSSSAEVFGVGHQAGGLGIGSWADDGQGRWNTSWPILRT